MLNTSFIDVTTLKNEQFFEKNEIKNIFSQRNYIIRKSVKTTESNKIFIQSRNVDVYKKENYLSHVQGQTTLVFT